MNIFSRVFRIQLFGGCADDLEYDFDRTFPFIEARNSERNSFAVFGYAEYDELTRSRLFGDERGFDFHLRDSGVERPFADDSIHMMFRYDWLSL